MTSRTAPTRTIDVRGTPFAYRELGPRTGVPLVFLHHFTAVLGDWDPRVIDGIAAKRHVIAFDNRGVGGSGGSVPHTIDEDEVYARPRDGRIGTFAERIAVHEGDLATKPAASPRPRRPRYPSSP